MSSIVVFGGTGYAGTAVVKEAASRGHQVTSVSRHQPSAPVDQVAYLHGNVTAPEFVASAVTGADVVVSALSPRGELDGKILDANIEIARRAREAGAQLVVVGGFSSLRPAAGELPVAEGDQIPEVFRSEALQMHSVLNHLKGEPEGLDWVFFSPASEFGAHVPGDDLGRYRTGGEVALFNEEGRSAISGPDFARAVVDHIDGDERHRGHVGVAY